MKQISIEIIHKCPNRCLHCSSNSDINCTLKIETAEVKKIIDSASKLNTEVLSISGGEPFLQAKALAKLVKLIKENSKLDIMLYSGYTLKQLREMQNAAVDYILGHIDLLVDGEYVEELNHNTIYRGSDNQVIHFLSSKYISFREKINNTHNRSVEFVYKNDDLFLVGIPEKGFDEKFWQNLQKVYLNKSREDIK